MSVEKGIRLKIGKTGNMRISASKIFRYAFVSLMMCFTVLPLVYVIVTAFKPDNELFVFPPKFFVRNPTLQNFSSLIGAFDSSSVPFLRYAFNSAVTTSAVVALTILFSAMAAYGLSKKKVIAGKFLFALIIAALSFPTHVTQVPNYIIAGALGLINTLAALVIPKIAVGYNLFLMKQFCEQIPDTLLEAARIDGAREWTVFSKLVFPMLKPAWATLIVLSFISNWNDYFSPLVYITDESLKTLPLIMSSISENGSMARVGSSAAATFLMTMPTILIFVIMQKQVIETMTHSGIKE